MKAFARPSQTTMTEYGVTLDLGQGGQFAVQVLEPSIFRVRWRPSDGYREPRTWAIAPDAVRQHFEAPLTGRERDSLAGFSLPSISHSSNEQSKRIRIASSGLSVEITLDSLALHWHDANGQPLAQDRSSAAYMHSQRTGGVRHYLARDKADHYYGLGDKTGPLNLHGRRLRTIAMDSLGADPRHGDPLYKHWPFVLTRTAQGQWYGIYYDTLAACTFDLGCEHDNYYGLYRHIEIDDGDLDYYFMAGASPADVIAQFVRLVGGTALPPRWSLGFAQTAMGLADAPDAQVQLQTFIAKVQSEGVPISSFHYGSGYSSRGKRRYVFTWNNDKFPNPKQLNAQFHSHGMRVVANVKPCLLDDHPAYNHIKASGGFVHHASSQEPINEQFWDGIGAHLDFSNPATAAWWQQSMQAQVLDYGIDVPWNDNNEYAVLDDDAQCNGFGTLIPMHRARPLQAMLMTRASIAQQAKAQTGEAVYSVSRGGSPGIQRYAQTWSGDNSTSWQTLRWNIRTGLQMSLSGMFNTGHDVGGFAGPVPDPELFVRWVQACCLNPRMVMNSWKEDGTINLPWMHPSVTPDVLATLRLRYALMPYLWQQFEAAHLHHKPIIRPTFYNFPDDDNCLADCDDFMLGDSLLVAPVVEPGQRERRVYLPHGPDAWFDFYTSTLYAAGQWHVVPAPLNHLPLFATAGSRIPVANPVNAVPRYDDPISEWRSFA